MLVYIHETGLGERKHSPGGAHGPIPEAGIGAQILADLGLTPSACSPIIPAKVFGLDAFGIEIADRFRARNYRNRLRSRKNALVTARRACA